jgi:photosystem II stability/assembly factor-like uncharacterized protein
VVERRRLMRVGRGLAVLVTVLLLVVGAMATQTKLAAKRPDAPAEAKRLDAWKVIGMGGGGAQYIPTISPHDSKRVLVRCDMTGAYISNDRGDSWRMFNLRNGVHYFAYDPIDPECIYAISVGLFRSTDGGKTWRLVYPDPADVTDISKFPDHGDEQLITKDGPAASVDCVTVDPGDSKTLYAVMTRDKVARLMISKDWGKTWKDAGECPNGGRRIFVAAKSPNDDKTVYVFGSGSVSVLEGGEWKHQAPPEGVTSFADMSGGFNKDGKLVVYGVSGGRRGGPGGMPPGGAPGNRPGMDSTGARADRGPMDFGGGPGGAPGDRPGMDSTGARADRGDRGPMEFGGGGPGGPSMGSTGPSIGSTAGMYGGRRGFGGSASIYVSEDGGATWRSANEAFTGKPGPISARMSAIAACEKKPNVAYISVSGLTTGDASKRFNGIAKTEDFGKTWKLLELGYDNPANVDPNRPEEAPWMYDLYEDRWEGVPAQLGVAPSDPDVVFGTDLGATMRSVNGCKTWRSCNFEVLPGGSVTTRGLDVTTCYGVHFDPFDANRMFISYTDIGAFKSDDGGTSWRIGTTGVPRSWRNTTYWIVFDPEVKGRAWGGFSGPHDLPRPKMWRGSRNGGRFGGGVCVTNDGGDTWIQSTDGMVSTSVTHIILDPKSPKEARTLYAAGFGTGAWKSVDGGKSWTLKNTGIEGEKPFAWRFTASQDGALYLIVARRSEDGSIGNEGDGALYRSTDGAEHWEKIALPEGCNGPNGLAVDADNPKRLYLAAWCRAAGVHGEGGGIFISDDAGKTWRNVYDKCQHVYDVTIDPRDSKTLYACGFENGAYRSTDRGETWTRLKGMNFKWGHRVICDPKNPGMIYVTTFGGSVWYGPAGGDPKAKDDIVTPEVAY